MAIRRLKDRAATAIRLACREIRRRKESLVGPALQEETAEEAADDADD
jgi:hypothetical protein